MGSVRFSSVISPNTLDRLCLVDQSRVRLPDYSIMDALNKEDINDTLGSKLLVQDEDYTINIGDNSMVINKVIVMITMTIITFTFGMMPLKLYSKLKNNNNPSSDSRTRWKKLMSFSSCFGGGVFMAACLLDLLPDIEEKMDQVMEELKKQHDVDLDYPVSQFLMVAGFLLILAIEQSVLHFQELWKQEEEREPLLNSNTGSYQNHQEQHGANRHRHLHNDYAVVPGGITDHAHHAHDGGYHAHLDHDITKHSSLRSVMLLLALSFHSVFEGVAIGLQDTSGQLVTIFTAVMMHKAVMAFSLGLNIAQTDVSNKNFLMSNIIFSIASPIGVGVGIAVADLPPSLPQDLCNGILQGIAGGTFLYITFFEVLPHELNLPHNRLWKVLFVILGFSCICALMFVGHGHAHGHAHGHGH